MVAMAHPHGVALALFPQPFEQRAIARYLDSGPPELAFRARFHGAAKLFAERLLPVADAKDRHPGIKHLLWRTRGVGPRYRAWPAGQDDAARTCIKHPARRRCAGKYLRVDAGLAKPPCYELGDLRAKIYDEYRIRHAPFMTLLVAPAKNGHEEPVGAVPARKKAKHAIACRRAAGLANDLAPDPGQIERRKLIRLAPESAPPAPRTRCEEASR